MPSNQPKPSDQIPTLAITNAETHATPKVTHATPLKGRTVVLLNKNRDEDSARDVEVSITNDNGHQIFVDGIAYFAVDMCPDGTIRYAQG